MSSHTMSQLTRTIRALRPQTRSRAFICTQCRATLPQRCLRPPFASPRATLQPLTTRQSLRRHASSKPAPSLSDLLPTSYYDLFPTTFPAGKPPASPFQPDLKALRREYLTLQARAHPDIAGRSAEAHSTLINEAYRTLQDPLRRAVYLLSQRGVDVDDESAQLDDPELLMEVMDVRERVDEAESEQEVQTLRTENQRRVDTSVDALETLFAQDLLEMAAKETIKLRYWMNVDQSIAGWEEGKGAGAVHH